MKVKAIIKSNLHGLETVVSTNGDEKHLALPVKPSGYGSGINGGELLMAALAVCYCNDIYREAAKRNIAVTDVEVSCSGVFPAEGKPGEQLKYNVIIESDAGPNEIADLIIHTDKVAEIHVTLRNGTRVEMDDEWSMPDH
jgi:uncharacterized OsmC-like protein